MTAELLALLDDDPAAGLRAVADLMRTRANAATPGLWMFGASGDSVISESAPAPSTELRYYGGRLVGESIRDADQQHVAAVGSPAVALAVADWLEWTADNAAFTDPVAHQLAVAHAYLTGGAA